MLYVTSTQNKTYKLIKSLKQKKARDESGLYCVEGIKSCLDAVSHGAKPHIIAVKESVFKRTEEKLLPFLDACLLVSDEIFDPLCDTKTPEGIICAFKTEKNPLSEIKDGLLVYLDSVSDPGNIGTIIRTADAAGASGVLLSPGCADLYNPKTVRSSMGSFFSVKAYTGVSYDDLKSLKNEGYNIICGALSSEAFDFKNAEYNKNTVIVIGNEANGISDTCLSLSDQTVIIPILGKAESLNASVAAALLMYEWQRNNGK